MGEVGLIATQESARESRVAWDNGMNSRGGVKDKSGMENCLTINVSFFH